jgi:hypothetical protein
MGKEQAKDSLCRGAGGVFSRLENACAEGGHAEVGGSLDDADCSSIAAAEEDGFDVHLGDGRRAFDGVPCDEGREKLGGGGSVVALGSGELEVLILARREISSELRQGTKRTYLLVSLCSLDNIKLVGLSMR